VLNRARAVLRLQPAGARLHSLLNKKDSRFKAHFTECRNSSSVPAATDPHHIVIPIVTDSPHVVILLATDTFNHVVIPTRERSEAGGICF
jgi:hypothetical protein